jgi:hypothetical protein
MGTLDFSSLAIDWVDVQSPVALRAPKGSPRPARRPEDPVLMPNSLVELQRTIRSLPANWCGGAAPAYFG